MGKGSRRRPSAISQPEFDRRWALAFGKHGRKPRKGKPSAENTRKKKEASRAGQAGV